MNTLSDINDNFKEVKEQRRKAIVACFDGRTQRFLSEKTGIDETKLSKWVNGISELEETEVTLLETFLGVEFK